MNNKNEFSKMNPNENKTLYGLLIRAFKSAFMLCLLMLAFVSTSYAGPNDNYLGDTLVGNNGASKCTSSNLVVDTIEVTDIGGICNLPSDSEH